ncbi:hypothetical protein UNDYM_4188 [Undibacterium sp. YM2]|nr:hypothetical protein UNDYM_4188 [Undibacterium sp. YM2]
MHITTSSFLLSTARKYLLAVIVLVLSGCVTLEPVLQVADKPKSDVGYVAGAFVFSGGGSYALGVTNVNGGEEFVLPFIDPAVYKTMTRVAQLDRVTMIQLPPGRYRVSSWLIYDYLTKEKVAKKTLPENERGLEFTVTPGRVRYLGKFSGMTTPSGFRTQFRVESQRITAKDLSLLLEVSYPNFTMDLLDAQPGSVY